MTSQIENSIAYNDPIEMMIMKRRADEYIQALEIAQAHAIAQSDGTYRQETTTERIDRLENYITSLQRTYRRQYDFLIGIIEERTLVLTSADEMYDDYS